MKKSIFGGLGTVLSGCTGPEPAYKRIFAEPAG